MGAMLATSFSDEGARVLEWANLEEQEIKMREKVCEQYEGKPAHSSSTLRLVLECAPRLEQCLEYNVNKQFWGMLFQWGPTPDPSSSTPPPHPYPFILL